MKYLKTDELLPNPFQPRKDFSAQEMAQLVKSVKEYGIIEPLIVRKNSRNKFELIAGERRLRAAKIAGLTEVPVILKDYDDRKAARIALIENLHRSNLNAMEEARAYKSLTEKFCMTQEEIARKIGKSRSHIANFMRLLNLDPAVQNMISSGRLSMGQAKPLLAIDEAGLQQKAAQIIMKKEFSSRKAEQFVKNLIKDKSAADTVAKQKNPDNEKLYLHDAAERLKQILGTNVTIKHGRKKSSIEIDFYSDDDLDRIVELLLKNRSQSTQKAVKFNI